MRRCVDKRRSEKNTSTHFKNGGVPRKQISAFRLIFEKTGAIDSAKKRIENDISEAKNQLSTLPASTARETLRWIQINY